MRLVMRADWCRKPLDECADFYSGGTPAKSNSAYWNGSIPWVSAKDMKSFRLFETEDHISREAVQDGARTVPAGTVLVLVRGMTLHNDVPICLTTRRTAFNQDIKALQGRDDVSTLFIAYWLLANKAQLLASVDSASHGTGRIRTEVLKAMDVDVPPPTVQVQITDIIAALDRKIEVNHQTSCALEGMARAIFKAWFIDFEPVKAKTEGATSFPGMPQEVFDRLPNELADTAVGCAPAGWPVQPIADIAEYVNGKAFTKHANDRGRMIIRIAELNSGPGGATKYSDIETDPQYTAFPDDILFAWSGSLDVYRWHRDEAIINQHIFKVIPADCPKWYVYYRLVEAMPFFQSIAATKATTMGHIKRGHLSDAVFAAPPEWLIEAAGNQIEPLYDLIHANERESFALAATRDTLLPKLISGELRIDEAV